MIAKASHGLTRRINILADKALLAAFADNVLESPEHLGPDVPPVVRMRHVAAAIRDSEYSSALLKALFLPARLVGAGALAMVAALAFLFWPGTSGVANQLADLPISLPALTSPAVSTASQSDQESGAIGYSLAQSKPVAVIPVAEQARQQRPEPEAQDVATLALLAAVAAYHQ